MADPIPPAELRLRGLLARTETRATIDQVLADLRSPEQRLRQGWRRVRHALIHGAPASDVLDLMDAVDRAEIDRYAAARRASAPRCELENPHHPGALCTLVFGHRTDVDHQDTDGRAWPWDTELNQSHPLALPICPVCQRPGCCCRCFGKTPRPDCQHQAITEETDPS